MDVVQIGIHKKSVAPLAKLPRVLIAEDSLLIAMELENILTDCGCEVSGICSSVEDALKFIDKNGCDLALVDYWLSDGTSEALVEALRRKSIPFIMCTGQSESDFAPELAGAPIVSKPYAIEDVQSAIMRVASNIGVTG